MEIKTLTEKDVLFIHDEVLAASGGLPGLGQDRSLASALHRINNYITYEGTTDLHEIASYYAIAIAQGHTFNDGNKRTALLCMDKFLDFNDITLAAPDDELEDMMVTIAEKKISHKKLVTWLKKMSYLT